MHVALVKKDLGRLHGCCGACYVVKTPLGRGGREVLRGPGCRALRTRTVETLKRSKALSFRSSRCLVVPKRDSRNLLYGLSLSGFWRSSGRLPRARLGPQFSQRAGKGQEFFCFVLFFFFSLVLGVQLYTPTLAYTAVITATAHQHSISLFPCANYQSAVSV